MKQSGKLIAAIASTAMLLGASACGSQPGNSSGSKAEGANVTTWAMTDAPWNPVKDAFKEWNKDHKDAQISEESFANDAYKEKIRTAVGSGNAPTFFPSWGGSPLTDYTKSKAITDLTPELKTDIQGKVLDSVAAEGFRDGKLYAVPTGQAQPVLMFYNKKVLKEAGIDSAPQTWDELVADVSALKAAGKTPISLAGGSKWPYLMWAAYLVDRIGGPEVFDNVLKGKKDAWSDPAVTKAMGMIQELVKAGAFGDSYQSLTADDRKDTALITTGQAGFELMGSWVYSDLISISKDFTAKDLGYAPLPTVKDGRGDPNDLTGNLSSYWQLSSKASKEQKKTFVDFIKTKNYSDTMVDAMLKQGQVPPVKNIESKIKAADDGSGYYPWLYQAVKKAPNYQLSWDVALPSEQGQAILNNLEQVFLNTMSPDQFVSAMNKTIK